MSEAIELVGTSISFQKSMEEKLDREISTIEKSALDVLVEDDEEYAAAAKYLQATKALQKSVKDYWEPLRVSANTNFKHSYPYTTKHLVVLSTGESVGGLPLVELWSKMNAEVKSRRAKQFELFICHKGNGLTFSNKLEEENGDYKHIAHLSDQGKLTWYVPYGYTPAQAAMKIREMADIKANQYDAWLQSLPENDRKMELMRHLTDQQFLAMTMGEW